MMRAGSKTAATVAALATAFVLAGCGLAEPPPEPPPPPDIEIPEAPAAPETPELPEAPEPPAAPEAPEPGAGSAIDVCGLLTPAEVEEAIGQPVEAERLTDIDCRYTTTGDPLTATELDVRLLQPVGGGVDTWVAAVEAGMAGQPQERVDGLGEAAVLAVVGADSSILHVKVGSTWLQLTAFGPDGPDRHAAVLKALAPPVVQRLS